jgi:hypothetical protein
MKDGVRSADKKWHNQKKMTELDDELGLTLWMSSISCFFFFFLVLFWIIFFDYRLIFD